MIQRLLSFRLLVVMLAAAVVACGTFMLGQWQLGRAAEKEALQAAIVTQSQRLPLTAAALLSVSQFSSENHRPVSLRGTWQKAKTLFLDNRPMGEKTGFWVYTPLLIEGSSKVVMVQRGWAARDFLDRTKLPLIETPPGLVTVNGRLAPPPSKLYSFKGDDFGSIRQNIDLSDLGKETGLAFIPATVVELGAPSQGLKRDWPSFDLGVDRHYGYAFQWFSLCTLVVLLFAWFQIIVPYRRRMDKLS